MDFNLSPEQELLRKTVREFAEQEIKPLAFDLNQKEECSIEVIQKMGDLGLMGMTVSPEYGGQGFDPLSYIIAIEEIARVDGSHAATVAAHNGLGLSPIYYFGNEQQKRRYLPDLCAGKALWGFGLTEPEAGSDAGNSQTVAKWVHGEWLINGRKIFITNASTSITRGSTVQAVTGRRPDGHPEISCILVEQNAAGFTAKPMHHKLVWRASNTSELYFEDVRVPEANLLGKRGEGFKMMLQTLDGGRLAIAAMGLGGAQGALEEALKYSQQRKTFGKHLAEHQTIAFYLAEMQTEIEAARSLLYRACWLKGEGKPFGNFAAMAKLYCSEVMKRVAHKAVQIHGGYGLMEEFPVARFYRDQRLLEIGEGASEVQKMVISRHLLRGQ
ncbi:MAG: acyl-CoA dehydrogenase family protein [Deltaproteobacteria bacterium]|nr:acyl-CoA dehydrogenase family protein [Deltaproteobacteria bacterium]